MNKRCIFLIGPPGVGKSTWLNENFHDTPHYVLSTDNIIEELASEAGLTYNEAFKKYSKASTRMMWEQLNKAVYEQWETIVVDRTNMSVNARKQFIERLEPFGYYFEAVCFSIPEETEWNRRLQNRPGKTIPQYVINSMMNSFQEPTINEGFSNIYRSE